MVTIQFGVQKFIKTTTQKTLFQLFRQDARRTKEMGSTVVLAMQNSLTQRKNKEQERQKQETKPVVLQRRQIQN